MKKNKFYTTIGGFVFTGKVILDFYSAGNLVRDIYEYSPTIIEHVSEISQSLTNDDRQAERQNITPKYDTPSPQQDEFHINNEVLASSASLELLNSNYPGSSWTV